RISSFESFLALAEAATYPLGIYLETKGAALYPGIEAQIVQLHRRRGWLDGAGRPRLRGDPVILQSFDGASLEQFARLSPQTPRVLLIPKDSDIGPELERAQRLAQGVGPHAYLATPWSIRRAHQLGLYVHPYVINGRLLNWMAQVL